MSDLTLRMLLLGEDRTASKSLKGLSDNASSTGKHMEGLSGKTVALGAAVGTFAGMGATALLGMGVSAIKSGVQTAASMEQADIAFTQLLGSGQKSQAFLADLSKFAAATPFELPGLVDASRQLIGVGESSKDVIPTLTAFGDASGALGLSQDNFNHIMMATTQAMSSGKFQAGDMLQITQAGLPVWNILAQSMGKPVAVIKDMASKGKLLSKDVMPALQKQMEKDYGGAMAKQSQTLTGLWSTLMDTFHQGMAKAIIPMEPMLRSAIPKAAEVMGKALGKLGTMMAAGAKSMGLFIKAFKSGDVEGSKLQKIGAEAGNMFAVLKGGADKIAPEAQDKFTRMAAGIHNAMAGAFEFIKKNGPAVFSGLMDSVKNLASVALPLLIQAWNAFKVPMELVAQFLIHSAIPAIAAITGWMAKHKTIVQAVAVGIGTIVVALKVWALVTKAMAVAQAVLNAVLAANPLGIIILAIIGLAAALVYAYKHSETFRNIVNGVFRFIADAGKFMWNNVLKPAFDALVGAFHAIQSAASFMWNNILRPVFKMIADVFLTMVSSIVHGAASAFGWVPGLGGKLKSAAKAFDQFKADVNSALSNINDKTVNVTVAMDAATAAILRKGNVSKTIGMKGYASGGMNIPDGVFTTGEAGFEVMRKSGSRVDILSNSQSRRSLASGGTASGGGDLHVHIDGLVVDPVGTRRAVANLLEQYVGSGGRIRGVTP